MAFNWWKLLHLVGLVGFLASHGVSMFVLYRIRTVNLDRSKIVELISFSGLTTMPMYISLGVLILGGVGAGLTIHAFWQLWLTVSIVILFVTVALMTSIAAPYFKQITAACEVRPSGVPRKADEELGRPAAQPEEHDDQRHRRGRSALDPVSDGAQALAVRAGGGRATRVGADVARVRSRPRPSDRSATRGTDSRTSPRPGSTPPCTPGACTWRSTGAVRRPCP